MGTTLSFAGSLTAGRAKMRLLATPAKTGVATPLASGTTGNDQAVVKQCTGGTGAAKGSRAQAAGAEVANILRTDCDP